MTLLRAKRKAGELLPDIITVGTKSHDVTLSKLGIERMQSSRWQLEADVAETLLSTRFSALFPLGKIGLTLFSGSRPVYCKTCYEKRRREREDRHI